MKSRIPASAALLVLVVTAGSVPAIAAASPDAAAVSTSAGEWAPAGLAVIQELVPKLTGANIAWFGAFAILLLLLSNTPTRSMRNVDAAVLALMCLLFIVRGDKSPLPWDESGRTIQWWSYLLLSVTAAYWFLRGLQLAFARSAPGAGCNLAKVAMGVIVVAGAAIALQRVANDPISPGSRDAVVGGMYTAEYGKLPYGNEPGRDDRSPLLYLVHAGAVRILPPAMSLDGEGAPLTWENRAEWINGSWVERADLRAVHLVNLVLFLLTLLALYVIGRQLHSTAMGLTIIAAFCVFPGSLQALTRPEIMLPTALTTWSLALAFVPGVGGLLSLLVLVFAGLSWPWAWLLIPVFLAFFLRRGVAGAGAVVGLLGGAALVLVGITWLVQPTLPRSQGAVAAAGIEPAYTARFSEEDYAYPERPIVIDARPETELTAPDFKRHIWHWLLERESESLAEGADENGKIILPNGVDNDVVLYRDIEAQPEAYPKLQSAYRAAIADEPPVTRMWVSLRSLLEATWLTPRESAAPVKGTWELWAGTDPTSVDRWSLGRRIAKIAAGAVCLLVGGLLLFSGRNRRHHLVGGSLAVAALAMFATQTGMAANLVWFVPFALAAAASHAAARAVPELPENTSRTRPDLGPAPRITVER